MSAATLDKFGVASFVKLVRVTVSMHRTMRARCEKKDLWGLFMKNESLGTYFGDEMVERFAFCGDGMFVALIVSSRPLLTSLC